MTVNRHRIVVGGSEEHTDLDHKLIRFQCAVPGCVRGWVGGSPAAGMDALVRLLAEHHGNDDDTTPLFAFP